MHSHTPIQPPTILLPLLFLTLFFADHSEYASGMGQHILCLAGEMVPAHDRSFNILKETTREVGFVEAFCGICHRNARGHNFFFFLLGFIPLVVGAFSARRLFFARFGFRCDGAGGDRETVQALFLVTGLRSFAELFELANQLVNQLVTPWTRQWQTTLLCDGA